MGFPIPSFNFLIKKISTSEVPSNIIVSSDIGLAVVFTIGILVGILEGSPCHIVQMMRAGRAVVFGLAVRGQVLIGNIAQKILCAIFFISIAILWWTASSCAQFGGILLSGFFVGSRLAAGLWAPPIQPKIHLDAVVVQIHNNNNNNILDV